MGIATGKQILIPADVPQRSELERVLQREGWHTLAYQDAAEAETALAGAPADAVVLLSANGKDRLFEVIKKIRHVCPDAFVLGVGGERAEDGPDAVLREYCTPVEVVTAVRLGADMRDARVEERRLRDQVRAMEEQANSHTARIKELEATCSNLGRWARAAEALALRDELTGLYNRRHFFQAANQQLARSRREKSRFAIAMMDIDNFKEYNDTYGHIAGDELLKQLAQTLLATFRRMDTVARYGGEEFIALGPETLGANPVAFDPSSWVDRVRVAVEGLTLPDGGGKGNAAGITVSGGVVLYPEDGSEIEDLVAEVDARLYRAKGAGRNRICASNK